MSRDERGEIMKFDLKQARKYSGFSQAKMADMLGIGLNTYRDYENGNTYMRVDTAQKFARLVNIPINNIIFYHETTDKIH